MNAHLVAIVVLAVTTTIVVLAVKDGRVLNRVVELAKDHTSEEIRMLEMLLNREYEISGTFDPLAGDRQQVLRRSIGENAIRVELDRLQIDRDHSFEAIARYLCKEARERPGLRSWSATHNLRKPEIDVEIVPDDTQIQPPRGATVYEMQTRQTDFGAWRFAKYLLPDWRRGYRSRPKARRRR